MEKLDFFDLIDIAKDWDKYCDFFGGRNLETKSEFEAGDFEERVQYLIDEFYFK